jgi:hypothetical protein
MNPKEENIKEIMNRFKWIDQNTFKIINKEGLEKIIDISDNFKKIEYNVIPLFDNHELMDPKRHFYTNRAIL